MAIISAFDAAYLTYEFKNDALICRPYRYTQKDYENFVFAVYEDSGEICQLPPPSLIKCSPFRMLVHYMSKCNDVHLSQEDIKRYSEVEALDACQRIHEQYGESCKLPPVTLIGCSAQLLAHYYTAKMPIKKLEDLNKKINHRAES
jgi:hypothetical protein